MLIFQLIVAYPTNRFAFGWGNMKLRIRVSSVAGAQAVNGFRVRAHYHLAYWSDVGSGRGTSTKGEYSRIGTIGQYDASGPVTNGQSPPSSGFWVLPLLVQTPRAPALHITNAAPGSATI